MQITLNGERREIADGTTVSALLESLGFRAEATAVQRNEDILEKTAYAKTKLTDGDTVELVRFVGGG